MSRKQKAIRLCDNVLCWNLIEQKPSAISKAKHHFCSQKCHYAWLSEQIGEKAPHFGKRCSKESRQKMSEACKGKYCGKDNPMYGQHHSEESRQKISKSLKGKYCGRNSPMFGKRFSEETRQKLSKAHKGKNCGKDHPNFGKHLSEETKKKLSESLKGKRCGEKNHNFGKHLPGETRRKMSESRIGRFCGEKNPMYGKTGEKSPICGNKNGNWKGGISFEPYCPKWTKELKERIRAYFNYECIMCGKTTEENGKNLSCHHVEYDKQACCDGKLVHFATLCMKCHTRTNHGNRQQWMDMIHRIIDEIYNSRSYYTKEEWKKLKEEN